MRLLFTLFVFCALTTSAWAGDFYQWTDGKGVIHFTDDPLLAPGRSKIRTIEIEEERKKTAKELATERLNREIEDQERKKAESRQELERRTQALQDSLKNNDETKQQTIRAAEETLTTIMRLWKNENFKKLYEYGTLSSQSTYSKEAFIARMERKQWKLDCCGNTIKIISSKSDLDTLVYVRAKIGYKKKSFGAQTEFVTETYQLSFDYDKWRISLFTLVYAP